MAKLSWGKPNSVEIGTSVAGAQATTWTLIAGEPQTSGTGSSATTTNPTHIIVEGTASLTTSKGDKQEARGEGNELVDTRTNKSSYTFEFELFARKSDSKPTLLVDTDGIIPGEFSIRVVPEDKTCPGFVMDCCAVSVEETWSVNDGKKWKYTFDALLPATGTMLKTYTKES